MDIQQTMTPAPVSSTAVDKGEKTVERPAGQAEAAPAFAQLLQGLQVPGELATVEEERAEGVAQGLVPEAALHPEAGMGDITGLGFEGLLGQTQRLDAVEQDLTAQTQRLDAAELALVGQTQKMDAEEWGAQAQSGHPLAGMLDVGAQPHVAIGQVVATVAAGVSSTPLTEGGPALATATAAVLLKEALPVVDTVAESLVSNLQPEEGRHEEGRLILQGAWKLEDQTVPTPALTRALGQIEQWAAAAAGVQPKAQQDRVDAKGAASSAAEWLSAGQGSGTRLTDVAVKETQAAQDAVWDAQTEAPVEDMRFWLQGKLQRAEVVLEKDGQPVRVQVSVRGNEAQVMFQADQAQTRELLDASVEQLRAMLEAQGVQLAGVSVQADGAGNSSGHGARNPWGEGAAQHAQVVVPEAHMPAARTQRAQGIDLYA